MPSFKQGDPGFKQGNIVRVPFPYTDRATRQHRPALVVSRGAIGESENLLWVTMVTSAENRRWQGDVEIVDLQSAGLPAPSVIRPCKIATIDVDHAELLGVISADLMAIVTAYLGRYLAIGAGRMAR